MLHGDNVILDEEFIRKLLINKKNLNITGYDYNEGGSSSPLCYAIFNNNKVLFKQLLDAGADINYQLEHYKWNALTYALKYADEFFIKELIDKNELDPYIKINGDNNIEHILSHQMFPKIEKKDFFNRIKMYIDYLKNKKDIDLDNLFNNNKTIFDISYPAPEKFEFIVKNLPEAWLKKQMDLDNLLKNKNAIKRTYLPFYIFEVLLDFKPIIAKKIMKTINFERVDDSGNTILHHCANLINNPNVAQYGIDSQKKTINEQILFSLLENNANPFIANKENKTVNDLLADNNEYKKYLINKNYNFLQEIIPTKENKKTNKLKI